jgi:hypothetical protein
VQIYRHTGAEFEVPWPGQAYNRREENTLTQEAYLQQRRKSNILIGKNRMSGAYVSIYT